MSETVQADDGEMLPLSSLPQIFAYAGGFIASITVNYAGKVYQQFFDNDGTYITYISGWNLITSGSSQPMITESGELMITEDNQIMLTE